ncbi:MAG: DUF11 domain-containing protein [Anaerolineales bacterium]|nr:DUF11 domain-containing protein [Anaerolineales bacterium]
MRHLRVLSLILPLVLLTALAVRPPAVLAGFTSTPTVPPVVSTPNPGIPPTFPSLEFTKSVSPAVANIGDSVTYTIIVRNPSFVEAPNVTILDVLVPELTFVSATTTQGTFSVLRQDVFFTIGTINPQVTVTLTITARLNSLVNPPAVINNTAVLSTNGVPLTSSNMATLQTVPGVLPETGQTPMPSLALTLLAVGLMFLPLAGMLWAKRRMSR